MDKQINHDNRHDESKTRTHRLSKLPDDGDARAPNKLLKSGAKEKHQLIRAIDKKLPPQPTKMNSFMSDAASTYHNTRSSRRSLPSLDK